MPRLNCTGPEGNGPRTGRGLGSCGNGTRCGRRKFFSSNNELAALEGEEKILEDELAAIREEKAALKDKQK